MSLGEAGDSLHEASADLTKVGDGYAQNDHYFVERSLDRTSEALEQARANASEMRLDLARLKDNCAAFINHMGVARREVTAANEWANKTWVQFDGLELNLNAPVGSILETTKGTTNPTVIELRNDANRIEQVAKVEEVEKIVNITGVVKEEIDPGSERVAKITRLLAELVQEIAPLGYDVLKSERIVTVARELTADATVSTKQSAAEVRALAQATKDVASTIK